MPGQEGLRMTERRAIKMQADLNSCIDALTDDLDIYTNMGVDDRELCALMRNGINKILLLWTDIQREFHRSMAMTVEAEEKARLGASMEEYRTKYKEIQTRALQVTAPLYNVMERERLEREAARRPAAGTGGGGRMAPKVDESLHPQFKVAFSLSLDEFRRWEEAAMAWGQASGHDQRPALMQKVYFESICEKEFSKTAKSRTHTRRWWTSWSLSTTRGSRFS